MSAHHYFKEFNYCDSGMIPWLLVLELISRSGQSLSALVAEQQSKFPSSGEINFTIQNIDLALKRVKSFYEVDCKNVDLFDGLSMSFETWRFNLRSSNTEPVVRLNVESLGNSDLVKDKVTEIKTLLYS